MYFSSVAYNTTLQTLKGDLKQSMLKKQNVEKTAIKLILSTVKNNEIDGAKQDEFALFKTFLKMIKQRKTSSEEYAKQNRSDLAEVEIAEIQVIEKYLNELPIATNEQVKASLTKFLTELKAQEPDLKVNGVFKLILQELAQSWKTSPDLIKPLVPQVFKDVYSK
ncbi:Altered inheritance of mitochondria protein 41 mitochondrial [Scheffersomyces spartinae]|uniref:Altered inheritance of mitochondria protein 41 n=1 Tax=Scheffersomyces spartinae TaxID=45513 RepID=A0A9P8AGX2_9ASCO|nr:Altered inheritance of mitochondria protein 41 mitochondrial [Scheffersomyces spartinae]KAG7192087.1 Altered inheritance of mitochondria protein 41 mitochondrial [Scheffersomyces spartinae]